MACPRGGSVFGQLISALSELERSWSKRGISLLLSGWKLTRDERLSRQKDRQRAWLKIKERQIKPSGSASDSICKSELPHLAPCSSSENELLVDHTKFVESFFLDFNKETSDELHGEILPDMSQP